MLAQRNEVFLQTIENTIDLCVGAQVGRLASGFLVKASGPNGFDMTIMIEDGRYALYFDNWAEEFDCEHVARQTFEAALHGRARLRVDALAGRSWRWTLERLDANGNWIAESTLGHVTWRFWGRRSSLYLRNDFPLSLPSGGPVAKAGAGQPGARYVS